MLLFDAISDQGILFVLRRNVVAEAHGVRLVSFGESLQFIVTITRALDLIRDHDERRFKRVQMQVNWIFDQPHWGGGGCASYFPGIKACRIDFEELPCLGDALSQAACYAGLIVHEATHGVLRARQIRTTEGNQERVERLCYAEQNRLLAKLSAACPALENLPAAAYNPQHYDGLGRAAALRHLFQELRRTKKKEAPNPQGGANGRQPFRSQASPPSAATASRRSP